MLPPQRNGQDRAHPDGISIYAAIVAPCMLVSGNGGLSLSSSTQGQQYGLVQGLGFSDGENIGDDVPAIITMFQLGVNPLPMFSVFLTSPSPPLKLNTVFPTASEIVLGGVSSKIKPTLDLVW